jgi:hypothetical protein
MQDLLRLASSRAGLPDACGEGHGEVAFASPEAQEQRTAELLGEGAVVCHVPAPPASMRRRLAEHVDEHLERALAARGAPSPYLAAWSAFPDDIEARIADQLFRARTMGASGVALVMGSLASIATPFVSEEDSAALRLLARVARSAPLTLVLDDGDAMLAGYTDPLPLPAVLGAASASRVVRRAAPVVQVEVIDAADATEEPPDVDTHVEALVAPKDDVERALDEERVEAEPAVAHEPVEAQAEPAVAHEAVEAQAEPAVAHEPEQELAPAPAPVDPAEQQILDEREAIVRQIERDNEARARQIGKVHVDDFWRPWVHALSAAKGPQPLAAFERLFVESYMPLASAITQGLEDPRALRAYDEFRRTFERAYSDAFATFGVTSRRPRLVMDAYDFASKQARLHNARGSHVVVVDSMRHDVGTMVRDELAHRAAGAASLTSEILLFAALPTTTMRQLETLARGLDALRAPAAEEPSESLRGRTAETVRRMRVGSRELYKLDVIPSMLASLDDAASRKEPADVAAVLEDAASHVAVALHRHIETLAPRTLLLVLGDHGFCVDRRGRVTHGGAAPEEVIVPAYAFLVGDLH